MDDAQLIVTMAVLSDMRAEPYLFSDAYFCPCPTMLAQEQRIAGFM